MFEVLQQKDKVNEDCLNEKEIIFGSFRVYVLNEVSLVQKVEMSGKEHISLQSIVYKTIVLKHCSSTPL